MKFNEIIGHQTIKQHLIQSIQQNKVSHTQLWLAQEGSGALSLAVAYFQYMNCSRRGAEDSCGTCDSCNKFNKLIYTDLHFTFPYYSSKSPIKETCDDFLSVWRTQLLEYPYLNYNHWSNQIGEGKQVTIYTTEAQSIEHKAHLKSMEGDYKFFILWHPEKMNIITANKLLKLLEEPPANTFFLLITDSKEQLLPTILSRTQIVYIPPIGEATVVHSLQQSYELTQQQAKDIAHWSKGDLHTAFILAEHPNFYEEFFTTFTNWLRFAYALKIGDLLKLIEEIQKWSKERQKQFFSYSLNIIEQIVLLNYAPDYQELDVKSLDFASKFKAFVHVDNVNLIYHHLNGVPQYIDRNANIKILMLDTSFKLHKALRLPKHEIV